MIRQRARLVGAQMALIDTLLLLVTFRLAYAIRAGWPGGRLPALYPLEQYAVVVVVAVPLCLVALWVGSVYRYRMPRSYLSESWLVVRALVLAAVLVATLAFLLKWHFLSRSFLVFFFGLAALILVSFKGIARLVFRAIGHRSFAERNVLVVTGSGDVGEIVRGIREHRSWGLHLVGVVPLSEDAALADAPRLGSIDSIDAVLDASPVDEVVFAVTRDELPRIDSAVLTCEQMGIRARLAVTLVPTVMGKIRVEEFDGHPLLDLSSLPDHEIRFAVRRLFDVALGGFSLLIVSPFLAVAGVLIRLEDGGPVLFRQVRCGLNGRKFELLKLRTMVSGADSRKESLLPRNEMSGPVFKIKLDPRVTRVGSFLRRFSIDELPQLWNVLRGDMALVGPRPPVPEEVARYERWQRRRLSMKPGMTGLWQVSGRSEVDFDEWMKLDLRYIDNWSFWLDLKILLKTFPAVISGRGAQ